MNFWRSVFSEESGVGSFSRVATGVLTLAAVLWVSFIVYKNHALPDLTGLALFVGTLYGVNQLKQVASAVRNGGGQK